MLSINSRALSGALPLLFISPILFAESKTVTELDEVIVSANRVAQTADETLVPVTVITRDDIDKSQASEVIDVLKQVPGLSILNSGGKGQQSSVSIRGTNSGHLLVLIDGVKQDAPTLGTTTFEHIPLSIIERIEVVRSPRSSLYGSEAIGGIIQIFTRKGGKGTKPSFKIGVGSNNTLEGDVNIGGGNDSAWFNLNLSTVHTDGIDACNSTVAGCFADEPDKDGYKRDSLSLRTGYKFNDNVQAEVRALRTVVDAEFDGFFQNEADVVQQSISANVSANVSDRTHLQFQLSQSRDNSDNFKDGVFSSSFDNHRDAASLQADIAINDNHSLVTGVDWQKDKVNSTTSYTVDSRDNTGLFLSYLGQFDKTNVEAAIRQDDNEQFGKQTTGSIALGHVFNNGVRIKASHGTAFKAPTFNQLYFPGFGNAQLQPEESKNTEIGISKTHKNSKWGTWEVNLFKNDIDNLIAGFPVSNTDKASIKGIELIHKNKLAGWNFTRNITLQKPENLSGSNNGKTLRYRPERIINLDIDRDFGRWNLGTSLHSESERFTNAANTDKLDAFTTVDLRAKYAINKNWSTKLKLNNLFDEQYETNKGYNQDGINGMITLQYSPK